MAGRWLPSRNKILKGEDITKKVANTASGTRRPGRAGAAGREGYGLRADAGAKGSGMEATN
jgi:hypothetical protein